MHKNEPFNISFMIILVCTPKIQVKAKWVSIKFGTKLLGFCEVVILSLNKFKEAFQTSVGKMYYRQLKNTYVLKKEVTYVV